LTIDSSNEARPARRAVLSSGRDSQASALPASTGSAGTDVRFESPGPNVTTTARGGSWVRLT